MKRVVPQESEADCLPSSLSSAQSETSGGYRRVQTSAAMLGLALSFGASAPFLTEPELALAADGPNLTVLPAAKRDQSPTPKLVSAETTSSSAYHTVESGESLWKIAAQHEADVQAIKVANGIAGDDVLRVGQVIRVPAVGMASLTVSADVSRLALKAGVAGGVGGDLATASSLLPSHDIPSADELEKTWQLEETLALTSEDELSEADLAAANLDKFSSEELESSASGSISSLPLAALPTLEQEAIQEPAAAPVADDQPAAASQQIARVDEVASATAEPVESFASLPLYEASEQPVATAQTPRPVAAASTLAPETASTLVSTLAPETASTSVAESKKDFTVAALPPLTSAATSTAEVGTVRSYQVKPGDTLWSITSRNGLTLDELLSHNNAVNQPEALSVGDSLSIPLASATEEAVGLSSSGLAAAPRTREQAIRDHLSRIRESNSSQVNRDALNARIREARQELERSRVTNAAPATVALEYHSPEPVAVASSAVGGSEPASATALASREGAQTLVSSAADAEWTVTDAAKDQVQPIATALNPAVEAVVDEPVQVDAAAPLSQLLAAAPLGADAYRVAPSMHVGQTVSPNMPMMPGANEFLPEAPRLSNGYVWPARGTLTSGYGWRWGRMHRGVDIAGPVGTPIVAAAPGVVARSGWNSGGYGNLVDIRHADGSLTRYAHNSRLLVREGEQVRQGQQIAEMGSTGYSTGPHLHFEVHLPSSGTVNPMAFLPDR
ncbi:MULTISPECIES: peptidoglycan DD-metalloendopeptidase family protein [Cyanophyceae]|uniref:peptidoglycan DD-metalloendopeptidase family protein n=1 Tax=Cyanophyceae TaxID=3028117 RepID=UPI001689B334|nr:MULTISPECIES: peptidoglycan DD-metalloendopeptidase family protein [Cyanophyceae]MBD1917912.1 peptidoglycan DD-metalloendopeptidase family protein [Phormidium sp. FACHB-77]MBD2029160.1 peptidoglycan DD-metalloendopeptidase family protein [Phormidium sp. FACHB-322]MBD2049692.1 peptidoglycan DD-metalloendopeptidase family protein [Leptolyngbya sp. FACHB-60]